MSLWSFQGAREPRDSPHAETPAGLQPVSQNSTACEQANVEVDVLLGEPNSPTVETIKGFGAYHRESAVSLERR
jgi:hypothetical protein